MRTMMATNIKRSARGTGGMNDSAKRVARWFREKKKKEEKEKHTDTK